MMRPRDDFGRFDQIIFFKDNPKSRIPNSLDISGEKSTYYGRGFYGITEPLPEGVRAAAPSFLPYDLYSDKIKRYEKYRANSLIRLETNDRTGFIPDAKIVFVVDREPAYQEGLIPLLQERPEKIGFFYPLIIRDEQTFDKIKGYAHKFTTDTKINFNYDYTPEFFINHIGNKYYYAIQPLENETTIHFRTRMLYMILAAKRLDKPLRLSYIGDQDMFTQYLVKWYANKDKISFASFFKDNKEVQTEILKQPIEIRSLLKQNPKTFDIKYIDF